MIKRITFLTAMLLLFAVPSALADSVSGPKPAKGKYIDIQLQTDIEEINIGDEMTVEVTITNLANKEISFIGIGINMIDWHDNGKYEDTEAPEKLMPYESITFLVTAEVGEHGFWRKEGDCYYSDLTFSAEFWVEDEDYYYEKRTYETPIKMLNLYDGSEYIEIEWLDDRENMYIYSTYYMYDPDFDDDVHRANARAYFKIRLINSSPMKIITWLGDAIIEPNEEVILYNDFDEWRIDADNIPETIDQSIIIRFAVGDKYYYYECVRTYNLETYISPDVDLMLTPDESDGKTVWNMQIKSNEKNTIDNLFVRMSASWGYEGEDYEEVFTIEPDEIISDVYTIEGDYDLDSVMIGRIVDGMIFATSTFGYEDYISFETFEYSNYSHYQSEYEFYDEIMAQYEPDVTITPSASPEPTVQNTTIEDTATKAAATKPQSSAAVVVVKRSNPMKYAYAVIGILVLGAVAAVVLSMKKTINSKKNEDRDD